MVAIKQIQLLPPKLPTSWKPLPPPAGALAGALGGGFLADKRNINNGYPILDWQYFGPRRQIYRHFQRGADRLRPQLERQGADRLRGRQVRVCGRGRRQLRLPVSNADDYATAEGTVTVKNKNVETTVQLELNKHTLTFCPTPKDAELTVKKDNEELKSNSDGSYSVTKGEYTYSASAFGYKSIDGTVTVPAGDYMETVTLQKKRCATSALCLR